MKIEEISINTKEYPQKLQNIYNPPKKLYVLGNIQLLNKSSIAVVGARKATWYGKKVAFNISEELSCNGKVIISGLALGIDTYAHLGALKALEKNSCSVGTIAVLGSGIDNIYPKENIELAREIIRKNGCIVSEYPVGVGPKKEHFPQRNRIISGLTDGVLVVEASKSSGALITADFALEQGKDVFAIPGDINKLESEGCNELIKDGAVLVTTAKEILSSVTHFY